MNPRYALVALRAGHRCEYCRAPEAIFNFPFELEHIVPVIHSGTHQDDNLALACRACNLFKADGVFAHDPDTGEHVPLFHPRQMIWNEHFVAARDSGSVLGLTPTGRATVAKLKMNSPTQDQARRHWIRLGLYP